MDFFPEYDKNAGIDRLSDIERFMECLNCKHLDNCPLGEEERDDERGHCLEFERAAE